MQKIGHDVIVFSGYPNNAKKIAAHPSRNHRYEYNGITVYRYLHPPMSVKKNLNSFTPEYNNLDAKTFFNNIVDSFMPDIVHFFHFQRVSFSLVDACIDKNIPTVFTPTDFWFECPTAQLIYSDMTPCMGPDQYAGNCIRHLTELHVFKLPILKRSIGACPKQLFALVSIIASLDIYKYSRLLNFVRSFLKRKDFIKERLNRIGCILVPNRRLRSRLEQFTGASENLQDLPFGIDTPVANPKPKRTKLVVGFIGTLRPHKGAHIFLQSVKLLSRKLDIEALLYGKWDTFQNYDRKLKKLVATDGRIKYEGTFQLENINNIFSNLDALVIPSLWMENTPLIAYYAQNYKCPILSSRIEGMADIVQHKNNGLFFEPGSAEELAECLKQIYTDREFLTMLSSNSISPLRMSEYAQAVEKVYVKLAVRNSS